MSTIAVSTKPAIVRPAAHPALGASMTVYVSNVKPRHDSARPRKSNGGVAGSRDVGMYSTAPTIPITAIGTFTRKIEPHQKCCNNQPPQTGPIATPAPDIAAHRAIAVARRSGSVKILVINDSVAGTITAAPIPMAARAAMSAPEVLTWHAITDIMANIARPAQRKPRRPKRSLRLPAASNNPDTARM